MRCPVCGADVPDGAKFCRACGSPVENVTTVRPPVADTVPAPAPRPDFEEAPSDPKEELRRAKAAYADARRAAGKSNAPKIVAACLGAALLVGAGAGATWFLMDEQARQAGDRMDELQSQLDDVNERLQEETARADAAESSAEQDSGRPAVTPEAPGAGAASDAGADSDAGSGTDDEASLGNSQSFVGTWTGELKEVSTPYGNCFGASTHPLKITIKSINSSTGQMKADVEVLFHGHDTIDDDADTVDGDRVVTFEDLTGTFEGDGDFRLKGNIDADDEYVVIEAEAEEYSYGVRLEVAVESWSPDMFHTKQIQVDSYDLSKA